MESIKRLREEYEYEDDSDDDDEPNKRFKQEATQEATEVATQIKETQSQFSIDYKKLLGCGVFAHVYAGYSHLNNDLVAVKRYVDQEEDKEKQDLEIHILQMLQPHPRIIRLRATLANLMILDYMPYTLHWFIQQEKPFVAEEFLLQLLSALAHCHKNGIIHRDVKPQNILMKDECLYLSDFGSSVITSVTTNVTTNVTTTTTGQYDSNGNEYVTLWYRAPELLLDAPTYGFPIDIWSVGVVYAEMLKDILPLLPGDSQIDQIFRTFKLLGTPTDQDWSGFSSLPQYSANFPKFVKPVLQRPLCKRDAILEKMLVCDPNRRATAHEMMLYVSNLI
jgi:serine/threonine protein kinase